MNIKKRFFRLTLVVSIILGILTPFCHEWFFSKSEVTIDFPDKWRKMSVKEKLNSIDGLLSNNAKYFLQPKIEQLNIRRQFKETIISEGESPNETKEKDERVPYFIGYLFYFKVGWREIGLLGFVGFASVWIIYAFIRWVIFYFIVGGFKTKSYGRK